MTDKPAPDPAVAEDKGAALARERRGLLLCAAGLGLLVGALVLHTIHPSWLFLIAALFVSLPLFRFCIKDLKPLKDLHSEPRREALRYGMLSLAQVVFYFWLAVLPIIGLIAGAVYAGDLHKTNKPPQSAAGPSDHLTAISNNLEQIQQEAESLMEEMNQTGLRTYRQAPPDVREKLIVQLENKEGQAMAAAASLMLSVEDDPARQRRLVRFINTNLETSHPEPNGNTPLTLREREAIKRLTLDQ